MFSLKRLLAVTIGLLLPLLTTTSYGQSEQAATPDPAALAKQLSNPIASLVSIPFQYNWEYGVGPYDGTRYILNVQPVMPFTLSKKLNLIGRWIMPYVSQPVLGPGFEPASGYGDIVASAFISPVTSSSTMWGIGPVLMLPSTSDPLLGAGKYAAGPTVVVLNQSGKLTTGFLANHLWSYADISDLERQDVNKTFLQPFLALSLPNAVTLSLNTEATADWENVGEEWTVPVNIAISKVTKLGPFPFSVQAGAGVYAEKPEGGPDWRLRTQFTLILPRGK